MHPRIALPMLNSLAVSQSLVLEAQDGTCGYLNGMKLASYGCQAAAQKCAVYYPTSPLAAGVMTDTSLVPTNLATPSFKTLTPRAVDNNAMVITAAPRVDYPAVLCCDSSKGDCAAQPTACVHAFEHPYSALCTGNCLNDPMTLKCTAGHSPHCNQIEFESPLYYQRRAGANDVVEGLGAAMGVAGEPARGWFCGPSALPTKQIESTAVAISQGNDDHGVKIGSNLNPAAQATPHSISPLTTASYTVTFTKHLGSQISTVPGSEPSPQAGSEGYRYELDAVTGEDCCTDEQVSSEKCCTDDITQRARRLQRRKDPDVHKVDLTALTTVMTSPDQIRLVTTTATPAAAPAMTITEGLAIISTAYAGQSNRSAFAEATRSWNVFEPTPTPIDTVKNKNSTGRRGPKRPMGGDGYQDDRAQVGRIVGGVVGGFFSLVLLIVFVRWCKKQRKVGRKSLFDGWVANNSNAQSRLSSIEEQSGGSTTPGNWPTGFLGQGNNVRPDMTSPRAGIAPEGRLSPIYQVSSLSDGSAVDEGNGTDGSSRYSSPCNDAQAIASKYATMQAQSNARY